VREPDRRRFRVTTYLVTLCILLTACDSSLPNGAAYPTSPTTHATETFAPTITTPSSTQTPQPPTLTPTPELPCSAEWCIQAGDFWLNRPISPEYNDRVDPYYRFGTTQYNTLMVHSGVEFVNDSGTPVLAAAQGVVVYAGTDRSVLVGPQLECYGNVIVLEHHHPVSEEIFYTLYGHLSEIQVETGEELSAAQPIGAVGATGVAEGSHLHFEVRLGENSYLNAVNPELYLLPPVSSVAGEPDGVLLVRLYDRLGNRLRTDDVSVIPLDANPAQTPLYPEMYAGRAGPSQAWEEGLVIGDLEPGTYRIIVVLQGYSMEQTVEIRSGLLTSVDFSPY